MISRLLGLSVLWLLLAAATPLPLRPPPPDLTGLLPWATAPLDKPPVELPRLALPPAPSELPPVAPAPLLPPPTPKPMAALPPPRPLPCVVGGWLRVAASESLECGRARLGRGELDEALKALDASVRTSSNEPDVLIEARYWYGEALYVAGRFEESDSQFRYVVQHGFRSEFAPWAVAGGGWTSLRLGDVRRAHEAFTRVLNGRIPAGLEGWARHGLGLALYGLGRYTDAEKVWADLGKRRGTPIDRDVTFWQGEVQGRVGQHEAGARTLDAFTKGGGHPLLGVALVRLGWWHLLAGKPTESLPAFRLFLTGAPGVTDPTGGREREWAEAGQALAFATRGDWDAARAPLRALDGRRSRLAMPVRVRLTVLALETGQAATVQTLIQEMLSATLPAPVRAWVLLLKGDAHRAEGNRDEARTQYDLAHTVDGSSVTGQQATLRLAETNFELREYAQAQSDLSALLSTPDPELRAAALVLHGESAYHAGDHTTAAGDYRRLLVEFPGLPQARAVQLALAWTTLRQGRRDDALRQFLEFARVAPNHPHTVDALVLASELLLAADDLQGARGVLDRVIANHGKHPRADFARLNRALLMARTGQPGAERGLREWLVRVPFPPLIGRAQAALGATLLSAGRPAEAAREFTRAQREGMAEFARLGLGSVALAEQRWADATRDLTEARDTGTPAMVPVAEYGLAVVAFHRGPQADFARPAQAALDAAPRGPMAPRLLYVLAGLRLEAKDWPGGLTHAKRIVTDFPADEVADDALERVGAAAGQAAAWPVTIEAYALLRQRYPQSPFAPAARLGLARAYLETGRTDEARRAAEEFLASTPNDPRAGDAWLALGRARDKAGDRAGALEAFTRAGQGGSGVNWTSDARLGHARALAGAQRWEEARGVLEKALRTSDGAAAGEVAAKIGEAWSGQGDHLAAAEYYLTAAYLAPQSAAGQRAMLEAARSLAAAKEPDAAAAAYRKLLAQSGLPADVSAAARKGLAELTPPPTGRR
jgi:tetratricopeptide (TPR) repeat protein